MRQPDLVIASAPPQGATSPFHRIMVAVAGDPSATAAVRLAAALAARTDAEVLAVHVSSHDVPCCGPSATECGLREPDVSLDEAVRHLATAGVRHRAERWQTVDDRVLETLLAAADEYDADLVIVGCRSQPGLRGRLRRSLGLRLAERTSRSILLVR